MHQIPIVHINGGEKTSGSTDDMFSIVLLNFLIIILFHVKIFQESFAIRRKEK